MGKTAETARVAHRAHRFQSRQLGERRDQHVHDRRADCWRSEKETPTSPSSNPEPEERRSRIARICRIDNDDMRGQRTLYD